MGNNFVAAQVEDVFGTNQTMLVSVDHRSNTVIQKQQQRTDPSEEDELGLFTPELIADDSSSVFLVVNYNL